MIKIARIIVTSRFLKCSSKKKLLHFVKYIATRPGVVMPQQNQDAITREKIVSYIATRPGAVAVQQHGLFTQTDAPIDLQAVANEIANHPGNVWTHVVSLRRDDAQRMGYETLQAWQGLVRRQMPNVAKHMKIDLSHLRWYAAFHDKKNNPHVHIVVYSTDPKEGFLTEHGIEKIRSGFANDVYADELHHLYEQQTDVRDALKKDSGELMRQLAEELRYTSIEDEELMQLVLLLNRQLQSAKGKKVYGYLKPEVKRTVDAIFSHIAQEAHIREMYTLWCEMEQAKHDVYSSAKVEFPAMEDNPEFKSVKNMIVRSVDVLTIDAGNDSVSDTLITSEQVNKNDAASTEIDNVSSVISEETLGFNVYTPSRPSNAVLADTVLGLILDVGKVLEDQYNKDHKMLQTDRKLRRMIQRKKIDLGMKGSSYSSHEV